MTDIIAHRGSKGTHPENTLVAFSEAVHVGAGGIELDIQMSKDNHLVIIHDKTVDRTTNGYGEVGKMTLDQLKKLNAGSWFKKNPVVQTIPTLAEVLTLLEKESFQGLLNLVIKTDEVQYEKIEQLIVQQMKQKKWSFNYMYSSFHFPSLEKIWLLDQSKEIAYVFKEMIDQESEYSNQFQIQGLHPQIDWLVESINKKCLQGKHIRPWTVNSTKQMEFCFSHNLTAFHTDYPEKAKRVQNSLKLKDN